MAFIPLRLPRIQQGRPIVDGNGYPETDFVRRINDTFGAIEVAYNGITDALAAAGIAQAAADSANMAAAAASAAASGAQGTADAAKREQALINSYILPSSVLTATPTLISIAAHTRFYADGTSAVINAGSVAATGTGVVNFVSYLDPTRAGGTVTFLASTTQPTQTGNTHVVGAITIPTTGTATGGAGPRRPGDVIP